MMPRTTVMIQPVTPGPVAKLASRKATNLALPVFASVSASASLAKLTMCATTWMTVPTTIDQAVALWKVMPLSKGMIWLSGVRRRREIKLRQTGRRMKTTSTCKTRAAARAMAVEWNPVGEKGGYASVEGENLLKVTPNKARAWVRLSFNP